MVDVEKTELHLNGYLQALVGREFSQENFKVVMSHIDDMLHKVNLDKINDVDWEYISNNELKVPVPPEGKKYLGLLD